MTEHEFELRMRAFYRAEVEEAGPVPAELWDGVWAIPDEIPRRTTFGTRRGFVVLAAAAMLTALLIAGAIAVGYGVLRLPWLPEQRSDLPTQVSGEALSSTPCDQTLADGLVVWVQTLGTGGAPIDLFVYEDGRLLRGPTGPDASVGPWEQRRLSPSGLQLLVAAIEESGLGDCRAVPIEGRSRLEVKARAAGGVVAMTLGSGWLRVASDAELDAAEELAERLRDPDLGIGSAEWVDGDWAAYAQGEWAVRVFRWEEGGPSLPGTRVEPWADIVLPDGSTLMTFGSPVPFGPFPEVTAEGVTEMRCRVLPSAEVDALRAALGAGIPDAEGQWAFHDLSGGVQVTVTPRLPHQLAGCEADIAPAATPESPGANLIADLGSCDFQPKAWRNEYGDVRGGWAVCESYPGGWVFVSHHAVSSDEALAIVENQFGVGFRTDEVAGRTVYLNACQDTGSSCSPAIAISADPYLFIVAPDDGSNENLRAIAEELIERLEP